MERPWSGRDRTADLRQWTEPAAADSFVVARGRGRIGRGRRPASAAQRDPRPEPARRPPRRRTRCRRPSPRSADPVGDGGVVGRRSRAPARRSGRCSSLGFRIADRDTFMAEEPDLSTRSRHRVPRHGASRSERRSAKPGGSSAPQGSSAASRASRRSPGPGESGGDGDRLLDRHADHAAPLGPAAVVVADALVAEQLVQHEPRVAAALADPAVGDDVLVGVTPLASYRSRSSSRLLNVPSSRTVWAHGMLAAPGMWPGRWAVSLMPGGAMISPANSAGLRTSTRAQLRVAEARQDVVAEGAQREVRLGQLVAGRRVGRHVGR